MRKWKWGAVKREDRDKRERQKVDGGEGGIDECTAQYVCVRERWETEVGRQRGTVGFLLL